jgi:hypothetical protein
MSASLTSNVSIFVTLKTKNYVMTLISQNQIEFDLLLYLSQLPLATNFILLWPKTSCENEHCSFFAWLHVGKICFVISVCDCVINIIGWDPCYRCGNWTWYGSYPHVLQRVIFIASVLTYMLLKLNFNGLENWTVMGSCTIYMPLP